MIWVSISFIDKFSPNFDLCKGIFMEKNDQNSPDFEESKKFKISEFYNNF